MGKKNNVDLKLLLEEIESWYSHYKFQKYGYDESDIDVDEIAKYDMELSKEK